MEVIINFDREFNEFKIYCEKTNSILTSDSLFKLLIMFSTLLKDLNINVDLLEDEDIHYIIDAPTLAAMVKSNVNLLNQLKGSSGGMQGSNEKFNSKRSPNLNPIGFQSQRKFK